MTPTKTETLFECVEIIQVKDLPLPAAVQQVFPEPEHLRSGSQYYDIYACHMPKMSEKHIDVLCKAYVCKQIVHWSYRDAAACEYARQAVALISEEKEEPWLFTWINIAEQWPYMVEHSEGMLTGVVVADEPSRLFVASVLQQEQVWVASLLLDGVHETTTPCSTREEAQKDAECTLIDSLRTCGLRAEASPLVSFDEDILYEVAALLTVILDAEMEISHLSEYNRAWVAVCISQDRKRFEDYMFMRDSDGFLGIRLRMNRVGVCL